MRWHLVLGGAMASLGFVLRIAAGAAADTLHRFDDALVALDDDVSHAAFAPAA